MLQVLIKTKSISDGIMRADIRYKTLKSDGRFRVKISEDDVDYILSIGKQINMELRYFEIIKLLIPLSERCPKMRKMLDVFVSDFIDTPLTDIITLLKKEEDLHQISLKLNIAGSDRLEIKDNEYIELMNMFLLDKVGLYSNIVSKMVVEDFKDAIHKMNLNYSVLNNLILVGDNWCLKLK